MKFVDEPCQRVVGENSGGDRDQVRLYPKLIFNICGCGSVIIQPRLPKKRVPSQANKKMDHNEHPDSEVMYFPVHEILQVSERRD